MIEHAGSEDGGDDEDKGNDEEVFETIKAFKELYKQFGPNLVRPHTYCNTKRTPRLAINSIWIVWRSWSQIAIELEWTGFEPRSSPVQSKQITDEP